MVRASAQRSGTRRWLPLAVAGLTCALSLAAVEVALRLILPDVRQPFDLNDYSNTPRVRFHQFDRSLGWIGVPSVEDDFQFLDCTNHVIQNAHGFRGPEYPIERSDRPRMVVLGDSFVWGFGVEEEEIFTSVLDEIAESRTEVVNLGVSGFGTDQELLLWRRLGRRFSPDEVVLVLTPYTDFWENRVGVAYGHMKPFFRRVANGRLEARNQPVPRPETGELGPGKRQPARPRLARLAKHSSLVSASLSTLARIPALRRILEQKKIVLPRGRAMGWPRDLFASPPTEKAEKSWTLMFALVDQLRREVEATGASFSLLLVPPMLEVYPDLWQQYLETLPDDEARGLAVDAPHRHIVEFSREEGVRLIDPTDALLEAGLVDPDLYYPINGHWTAAGHAIVAERVLEAMDLNGS